MRRNLAAMDTRVSPEPPRQGRAERVGRWLAHRAWYHREGLAPIYAGGGLLASAMAGHTIAPGDWWLAVPGVAVPTIAAIGPPAHWWDGAPRWLRELRWGLHRESERAYAALTGAGAGGWLAVTWWHGPDTALEVALVILGAAPATVWWLQNRRPGRVKRIRANWEYHAKAAGIPRSEVSKADYDDSSFRLHLRLRGHTVDEVRAKANKLAMALGARQGSVTVERGKREDQCMVIVDETEPDEPTWRHHGQEVGRPAPAAYSVEPLDEDDEPEIAATPFRPVVVRADRPEIVDMPRQPRIAAPASDPLLDALRAAPEPLSRAELQTATGIAYSTLGRRLDALLAAGAVEKAGYGKWRPAAGSAEAHG